MRERALSGEVRQALEIGASMTTYTILFTSGS